LKRVIAHIDKLADARRYSAVYTGLSLDADTRSVDVWRVPSTAFDADVCGAVVEGVTVRLHSAGVGRKTLDRLSDRPGDDMKRWDGTSRMREVGVDEPIIKEAYGA
jgi:hypothetical protein